MVVTATHNRDMAVRDVARTRSDGEAGRPVGRPGPVRPRPHRRPVPQRPHLSLSYRPALDGVRAIAVLAILVYHGLPNAAPGGFLGVDVFFVLSGYLITSLLVREADGRGRIRLGEFWARRARRLLPALVLVCGGIVLLAWASPHLVDIGGLGGDLSATVAYVANWRFVLLHHDYFGEFVQPSLLGHMWSLAIEEQFYVLWPLVVAAALVWRRVRPSRFAIGCAVAAVASATWMAVLSETGASTSRLYYGTDTRAQALLVGAALGAFGVGHRMLASRPRRVAVAGAGIVGLAGIVACFVFVRDGNPVLYTGGFLVAALLSVALVADAGQPDPSPLGRLLGVRPLVAVGKISYGLYLWHWPVDVLVTPARLGAGGLALFGVRAALTFAMAAVSYRLVERPIRRGAFTGWRVWVAMPAAAIAVMAGGIVLTQTEPRSFTAPVPARRLQPAAGSGAPPASTVPGAAAPTRVLVVGDSIAVTIGVGLNDLAPADHLVVSNDGILGCGILRGGELDVDGKWSKIGTNCQQWPQRWAFDVGVADPQVVVVLTGTWDAFDRRIDGRTVPFASAEGRQLLAKDLRDALDVLSSHGAHVLFLTTPYIAKQNDPNPPAEYKSAFDRSRVDAFNALLRDTVGHDPRATVVDMNRFLAPDGHPARAADGQLFQTDLVHLGPEGRAAASEWLAQQIETWAARADG